MMVPRRDNSLFQGHFQDQASKSGHSLGCCSLTYGLLLLEPVPSKLYCVEDFGLHHQYFQGYLLSRS